MRRHVAIYLFDSMGMVISPDQDRSDNILLIALDSILDIKISVVADRDGQWFLDKRK